VNKEQCPHEYEPGKRCRLVAGHERECCWTDGQNVSWLWFVPPTAPAPKPRKREYTPHELRALGWTLLVAVGAPDLAGGRDYTAVHLTSPSYRTFTGSARRNPKDPYDFGLAVRVALGRAVKAARKAGALE
jgi:hypothetical protein